MVSSLGFGNLSRGGLLFPSRLGLQGLHGFAGEDPLKLCTMSPGLDLRESPAFPARKS